MKRVMVFLLHIPLAIFTFFEYFMFMWFWGGDGAFTFFGCGITFIIYLALHILAFFKTKEKFKKDIK